ncbi:MAG: GldG family protein [Verrucomicrobia bacterium]|nr:GldG family protein [Verrucomicrobiota bacterium]
MSRAQSSGPSFSAERRWRVLFQTLVSSLALAAIVGMANYLSARHFRRFQWAERARYELSPATRRVLASVTNQIQVIALFDKDAGLYQPVSALLREYAYACPQLRLEFIDYTRDPGRAELIAAKYALPASASDLVIFDNGSRRRVVQASELSDYDIGALVAGAKEARRINFKGEPAFTAAIAGLIDPTRPKAYFLSGHGEHDPESREKIMGYSRFAELLESKNVQVRKLLLAGNRQVPEDCALLVIAGPRSPLDPGELEAVDRYLQQGGRLLALLSFYQARRARTGLENYLLRWGVRVGDNYALDPPNSIRGNDLVCTNFYLSHPVMRPLKGRSLYLVLARSVMPEPQRRVTGDAPQVQPLFTTSRRGFTASAFTKEGLPRPAPGIDRQGTIPLAAAVEKGNLTGMEADRASTRLVIVGESIFLGNETIVKLANWDFAASAVNWLLDRPLYLAGIAPKPLVEYRINLTRSEMNRLRWLLLVVLPGGVLALGALVKLRRRA